MYYNLGDKQKICLEFEIISNKNIAANCVWGRFQFWINSKSFGDFEVEDFISGNIGDMILKLKRENIPDWAFALAINDNTIFEIIFENNFGDNNVTKNMSIHEIFKHENFWNKYVLSPNSEIEFDEYYIFYYLLNNTNAKFIYKDPSTLIVESINIDVGFINSIAIEFDRILSEESSKV
jgi:hypothetical protein